MQKLKRLGEAELDIMHVVWHNELPVRAAYVSEQLRGKRNWQLSSIMTVLSRLVDKGFLTVEKVEGWNMYAPQVSEKEYQMSESAKLLKDVHAGSVKSLVASLVGGESVTQEELEDLRAYLDKLSAK